MFVNRWRWLLCLVGLHRWETLYGPGRPDGIGSGKYGKVIVCPFCAETR